MRFTKSLVGYFFASIVIVSSWDLFINKFGIKGSYLAALFLTGPCWYINHYKNLIKHKKDEIFIDMALAIGIATMIKSIKKIDNFSITYFWDSLPTLYYLGLGAIFGVLLSLFIKRYEIKE